jgi:hypothetical protein
VECDEIITNPISEQCLALEFKTWLAETDKALAEQFNKEYVFRSTFMPEDSFCNRCIITNEQINLCPYCVTTQFITWLHGKTVSPKVLEWALDFFVSREDEAYVLRSLRQENGRGVKITLDPFLFERSKEKLLS